MKDEDKTCDEIYRKIMSSVTGREIKWVDSSMWRIMNLSFDRCDPFEIFLLDRFIYDRILAKPEKISEQHRLDQELFKGQNNS